MVDISRETYERNGVEAIVDSDVILWLNEKYIEEGLGYFSGHKTLRYKLVDKPKKQTNREFRDKKLATKVIMDCRTTAAHKLRTRLGFKKIWCHVNQRAISVGKN